MCFIFVGCFNFRRFANTQHKTPKTKQISEKSENERFITERLKAFLVKGPLGNREKTGFNICPSMKFVCLFRIESPSNGKRDFCVSDFLTGTTRSLIRQYSCVQHYTIQTVCAMKIVFRKPVRSPYASAALMMTLIIFNSFWIIVEVSSVLILEVNRRIKVDVYNVKVKKKVSR
ncbi:CLUMA_CG018521, isoform A [Clunio marinus]|uniref:CLUMA_CG018521, isoform A n=1 Tax=Clunio marinus TaxID=568069 RepID=A0A1J1J2B4_9DIPT|nr:CLUMA_CG018521, isoform A [Clunio marinus]